MQRFSNSGASPDAGQHEKNAGPQKILHYARSIYRSILVIRFKNAASSLVDRQVKINTYKSYFIISIKVVRKKILENTAPQSEKV